MRTVFRLLVLLLAFAAGLTTNGADQSQMAEDFAWFSSLGYPDVKGLTFIHYLYRLSPTGSEAEMKSSWSYGWLLAENPNSFTARTLTFETEELTKSGKTREDEHRFEPDDLRQYAEEELKPLDDKTRRRSGTGRFAGYPRRTQLFVLAWMCSRQRLDDLAAKLYTLASESKDLAQALPVSNATVQNDQAWPFRRRLERDLGSFELQKIILDFEKPKVSRKQLLPRLQAMPLRFPHCDQLQLAAELAGQLETMIREDDAHPILTADQIAMLPPDEQAKEWIFQLRDANARQMSLPGSVNFFRDFEDPVLGKKSAVRQLAALGDAAIPALIEALGDRRPTRSVEYGHNFFFSGRVVPISEAALQTIEKIAGRSFHRSGGVQGTEGRDGLTNPVPAAVQGWWKEHLARIFQCARTGAREPRPTFARRPRLPFSQANTSLV